MTTYRTGGHWQRTIVRVGTQPPDHEGRRPDDQLVGMVDTSELAARICALLNGTPPPLVCVCNNPPPTVTGKNQPATRPPGWSCPKHGVVL